MATATSTSNLAATLRQSRRAVLVLLLMMLTTATWAELPTIDLTLYKNDGSGVVTDISVAYDPVNDTYPYSLSSTFFTREGHSIIWWSTSPLLDGLQGIRYGADETIYLTESLSLYAIWDDWADLNPDASYSLSLSSYKLAGAGYTDITCTLTSLVLGKAWSSKYNRYEMAKYICFYMNGGTLDDGHGHSIAFKVADPDHINLGDRLFQGNVFYSQGDQFVMAVYIDPNEFAAAMPGTYTGTFTYDGMWRTNHNNDVPAASGSITLTLEVPLRIADDADNDEVLGLIGGEFTDVTLTGRTLYKDGTWNTLCLPFDVRLEGSPLDRADVRELNSASFADGTLTLNFTAEGIVREIKDGVPYIIRWDKADGYDTADPDTRDLKNPEFSTVFVIALTQDATFSLDDDKAITFKGTYSPVSLAANDKTTLYLGANNTLYYPNADMQIGSCRAYFKLTGFTAGDPAAGVRDFVLNFGDESTAIRGITDSSHSWEGSGSAWYSLDGRQLKVKPTQRGVYVNKGKKIVIK